MLIATILLLITNIWIMILLVKQWEKDGLNQMTIAQLKIENEQLEKIIHSYGKTVTFATKISDQSTVGRDLEKN